MVIKPQSFRRLCRARDLLCEDRERPLSIRAVTREISISPYHFIRQSVGASTRWSIVDRHAQVVAPGCIGRKDAGGRIDASWALRRV